MLRKDDTKKFVRDGKPTTDAKGRIVIRISLAEPKRYTPLKNNCIKLIVVQDATVTEVCEAIERALF